MDLKELVKRAKTRRKSLERLRKELGEHSLTYDVLQDRVRQRRIQIDYLEKEIVDLTGEWAKSSAVVIENGPRIIKTQEELDLLEELIRTERAINRKGRQVRDLIADR